MKENKRSTITQNTANNRKQICSEPQSTPNYPNKSINKMFNRKLKTFFFLRNTVYLQLN